MSEIAEDIKVTEAAAPADDYKPVGPWTVQFRVIKAIVLRDMAARHGDSRLGPIMGIIMPLVTVGVIMLMFNLRGKISPADFPLLVFLITGYPVWWGFQQTYARLLGTTARVDALLAFPQITQLDLIIAAAVLDGATNTVVFAIAAGVVSLLSGVPPADPFAVMLLYWCMLWTGVNMALIMCALQRFVPSVVSVLNMGIRMLMWVSGVIYTVDRLPSFMWPYLQWNPLLHTIEGIRHAWVPSYQPPIFNPFFIIGFNFVLMMVGLSIERATRRHVGE